MRPVEFLRELLCLHGAGLRPERCRDPAHFDAIDIHPYALTPASHALNPDDVSVPDLGRLSRVLRAAGRTRRALPLGRKSIWVTELDWDSKPPDPGGVSLARQARYLSQAFYELWLQGVSHVLWYEPRDAGSQAARSFTGGGLFFYGGGAKPSSEAFRFPFASIRSGAIVTLWGRAPRARNVTIEIARGRGWRRLLRLRPTRGGVFYARRRLGSHAVLRARQGTVVSPPWATLGAPRK